MVKRKLSLLASDSYTSLFVVVSRIIVLDDRELSRRSLWQAELTPVTISLNKTFLAKSTQFVSLKAYKELYDVSFWTGINEVCGTCT